MTIIQKGWALPGLIEELKEKRWSSDGVRNNLWFFSIEIGGFCLIDDPGEDHTLAKFSVTVRDVEAGKGFTVSGWAHPLILLAYLVLGEKYIDNEKNSFAGHHLSEKRGDDQNVLYSVDVTRVRSV